MVQGRNWFIYGKYFGMISGWQKRGDWWTSTASPGFVQEPRSRGYSVTRRPASSVLRDVKKNDMRVLWDGSPKFLRPQGAAYPGPALRRDAYLSGSGDQTCYVLEVWEGEVREAYLAGRQPFLHEAIRLLCRPTVPEDDHSGRHQRGEAGLAYGQGVGKALYDRTAPAYRCSRTEGNRARRGIAEEGLYISNSGKRPEEATSHMVWR